jgi:hypothetical protein
VGDLIGLFEVVGSAIRAGAVEVLLCTPSAEDEADLVDELSPRVQLILVVEILREAQRALGAGDDGEFEEGVCSLQEPGDHRVSRFMHSHDRLLLRTDNPALFDAADESFRGHLEVMRVDGGLVVAGSEEGGLVAEIGDVCAAEARREGGQTLSVVVLAPALFQYNLGQVDVEDLPSALQVGQIDLNNAIETSWPDEGRVK